MDNKHNTWAQGYFVDQPRYRNWTQQQKEQANDMEEWLVRPSPTGNAICKCPSAEEAQWIAERLNFASKAVSFEDLQRAKKVVCCCYDNDEGTFIECTGCKLLKELGIGDDK